MARFADVHDSLVELLRTMDLRPLVELLGSLAGWDLRDIEVILERTPTIAVPSLRKPRKRVADLVLKVLGRDRKVIAVLVIELQLTWDPSKRWVWGLLAVAFAADHRRDARVFVFTPDPELRSRICRRLVPHIEPPPLVIEPDLIPQIFDLDEARRRPRETIFAALYHAAETSESFETRVAGIRAALIANRMLDREDQLRYGEVMFAMTPAEVMKQAREELLDSGELDEPDPDPKTLPAIFRQGYSFVSGKEEGLEQGRSEGLQQGRNQGLSEGLQRGRNQGLEQGRSEGLDAQLDTLRSVLVDILAARGIPVEASAHARIAGCRDVGTLARWCTRASSFTEGSLDDQLG